MCTLGEVNIQETLRILGPCCRDGAVQLEVADTQLGAVAYSLVLGHGSFYLPDFLNRHARAYRAVSALHSLQRQPCLYRLNVPCSGIVPAARLRPLLVRLLAFAFLQVSQRHRYLLYAVKPCFISTSEGSLRASGAFSTGTGVFVLVGSMYLTATGRASGCRTPSTAVYRRLGAL